MSTYQDELSGVLQMEPITTGAIAALVLNEGFKAVGKQLGDKAYKLGESLATLLKERVPKAAAVLVASGSTEVQKQEAVIEVEAIARTDEEVKSAIADLMKEMPQDWTIENWRGINIKGGTNTVSNNTLNF